MDKAELKPDASVLARGRPSARLWLLAAVVLGLFLLFIMTATKEQGPSHAARPAEDWLRDYANSKFGTPPYTLLASVEAQEASVEAFRQMGPDGISFLMKSLGRKDRIWNRLALRLYPRIPGMFKERLPEPIPEELLSGAAVFILKDLLTAQPEKIVPQLVTHLNSPDSIVRIRIWNLIHDVAATYQMLNLEPRELLEPYERQFRLALGDTNKLIRLRAVETMLRADMADSNMLPALSPASASEDSYLSNTVERLIRELEKLPPNDR